MNQIPLYKAGSFNSMMNKNRYILTVDVKTNKEVSIMFEKYLNAENESIQEANFMLGSDTSSPARTLEW